MSSMRCLTMVLAAVLVVSAAAGCAEAPGAQLRAPFVRSQHFCANAVPGSVDAAAARNDLAGLLAYVPGGVIVKYFKPHDASVAHIQALIAGGQNLSSYSHKDGMLLYLMLHTVQVTDDRVAVSNMIYVGYDELVDHQVEFNDRGEYTNHLYNVEIEGLMRLSFADRDLAQCVAEDLRFMQQPLRAQQQGEALAAFRAVADQYRAMQVKPQVPEEQRRFIVQANTLTQKREFAKAVALYEKALAVNPFSYPAAHYNMALISAQQGRYTAAITAMKKYLMLVPDAEDARTAQDKIYEWEALGGAQ